MKRVAITTDSNSGITQKEAKELGIHVLPMPFYINGELFYEDINLTQEAFYERLEQDCEISTSQPIVGDVLELWDNLLKDYDEVVFLPMSSGLSSTCATAQMLAQNFDGKVFVVDNQRISVTLKTAVFDAMAMAAEGAEGAEIQQYLEKTKLDSSIYITLETLKYLKKGGRITPAAAAIGSLLKLKPVLTIQGEKLDAFSKARTVSQGKQTMISAIRKDMETRFGGATPENIWLEIAYTKDLETALQFKEELLKEFPEFEIVVQPLSLSVACHIGPGSLAVACCKKIRKEV